MAGAVAITCQGVSKSFPIIDRRNAWRVALGLDGKLPRFQARQNVSFDVHSSSACLGATVQVNRHCCASSAAFIPRMPAGSQSMVLCRVSTNSVSSAISGLGLFLAALNVFVRDTALALPNLLTLLLVASPIFYSLNGYPRVVREILQFNPFYVIAACYRAPILDGVLPPLWMYAYLVVVSTVVFTAGLWWFRRLKSFFDTRL